MARVEAVPGEFGEGGGRRLSNYPPVSRTTIHGWGAVLFGSPFLAVGSFILGVGFELFEVDPSTVHAPLWIIAVAGGVFFMAGMFLVLHGLSGVKRRASSRTRARRHLDEPWMADHAWDAHGVFSRRSTSLVMHAFASSLVIGLLVLLNWVGFAADSSRVFAIGAGLFDLVFALVIGVVVKQALAGLKFGRSYLEFGEFPARPGEALKVRASCKHDVGEAKRLVARLRFVEERYVMNGTGEDRAEVVASFELYLDTHELDPHDSRKLGTVGLDLEFLLPEDAPSTNLCARPAAYWELELEAELEGLDLLHRYPLPVYGEAASPAQLAA